MTMTKQLVERVSDSSVPALEAKADVKPKSDSPVELVQISDKTWRVCDGRAADHRSGYIVGYLQRLDDEYEMLWMRPRPGVVHRHADFDGALRAIEQRLRMYVAA